MNTDFLLNIVREVSASAAAQVDAIGGHLMEDFRFDKTGASGEGSGVMAKSGIL